MFLIHRRHSFKKRISLPEGKSVSKVFTQLQIMLLVSLVDILISWLLKLAINISKIKQYYLKISNVILLVKFAKFLVILTLLSEKY